MSGLQPGERRPLGGKPAEIYGPLVVADTDWPLPDDRERVSRHPDYRLSRQIATGLTPDLDAPTVRTVLQRIWDSSLGESSSEEAALRLAGAQRTVHGDGWMVVPQQPKGLPGVDEALAVRTLAMDPDAIAENVAGIAQGTNPDLDGYAATNTALAWQNTDWENATPFEKANFLALVGPILGQMSVGMHALPPQTGEGQ